jgi:PAS domain S-box-containing protein
MISASSAMSGSYDYSEVTRSVVIAIAASYSALDLAGRVTATRGRARLAWLSGGAVAMGIGVWEMHFKGMLALHLPVPVEYHWPTILAALGVAIVASASALFVASRQQMSAGDALTGSLFLGCGIATLHYMCMAAMRLPATTRFSPFLVTCSIALAVLFSLVALVLSFGLRDETRWTVPRRLGSAVVMGAAVSAMHYTGMAAATFFPGPAPDLSHALSVSGFGDSGLAVVTLIVILAALLTSSVDRRTGRESQRLNQELERRVIERTSELETVNQSLRNEVAERRRAEDELKGSEQRHRVIVEAASDAVISMDEGGSILLANPATARIFGYDPSELIGKPLTVLMPEFMRKLHETGFRRYLETGERHLNWHGTEMTALRKNGEEFPVEVSFGEMISEEHRVFTGFIRDISEKKRAEDELRKQKDVFQKIFEHSPVMIAFVGKDDYIELVNPAWERALGWTLKEIRENKVDIFAEAYPDPEYRQMFRDFIARSTGEFMDLEVRVRDGRVIYVSAAVVHLLDGTSVAIGRDVTERKRAEAALRASEQEQQRIAVQLEIERARLIEAQAVAKVGSWETELPSLDITWSEQTHRIFETDPSYHPTRRSFVELVHPEDREKVDRAFQASLEKGAPSTVEYRIVMADGRVKVLEEHWKVFHDGQGRPTRLIGTCQDITERKRAEAELRESEARFRLVADSAPVMIWMAGVDKLCTYFNKPWLDFTGRSIDLELGNGWVEGVHAEDLQRCMDTFIQSFDRREPFRMEYRLRRHDGQFRWVLDIGVPRFNPDGSFAGYIGSCLDVTEQRGSEEQLREAHSELARVTRALDMGELAAAIAHEVNQPLTAIVTNAGFSLRLLKASSPNLDELRETITAIVNDGMRASSVISRIRGLLTKGAFNRTELDINQVIQDVAVLLRNELTRNRVSLSTELDSDLPRVTGDPVQLQQVLINLILNAIDATGSSADGRQEILIRSVKNRDGVLVQVQDSGPGIEAGLATRIFEPFFTTKANGIGMGLAISQSIIESHGGRLWTEPSSGGGVFEFTLPTDRAA